LTGHPHQARIYREFGGGRQGSLGPWRGFPAPGSSFQPRGGPPGGRHGRPGDDPGPSAGPNRPSAGFAGFDAVTRQRCVRILHPPWRRS